MIIYLSPSNQKSNTYATGNTNERDQCRRMAEATKEALIRCGFNVYIADDNKTMAQRCVESNSLKADLHIPIHTNASSNGTAGGTRCFYYSTNAKGKAGAQCIIDTLGSITPGSPDKIAPYDELKEIKSPSAESLYIEVDFHDNPSISPWLIEHTKDIGEAICKGICKHTNVEYTPDHEEKALYRVQVGAFTNEEYAKNYLTTVQQYFPDAYIVKTTKGG